MSSTDSGLPDSLSTRQRDTIEYDQLEFSELSGFPQSYRPHLPTRLSVYSVGEVQIAIISSSELYVLVIIKLIYKNQ